MNVLDEIKKVLKKRGISKPIDLETEFKSLGLDSLDLVDLIIEAENKCDIQIPNDKLTAIKTVADLVDIINEIRK